MRIFLYCFPDYAAGRTGSFRVRERILRFLPGLSMRPALIAPEGLADEDMIREIAEAQDRTDGWIGWRVSTKLRKNRFIG